METPLFHGFFSLGWEGKFDQVNKNYFPSSYPQTEKTLKEFFESMIKNGGKVVEYRENLLEDKKDLKKYQVTLVFERTCFQTKCARWEFGISPQHGRILSWEFHGIEFLYKKPVANSRYALIHLPRDNAKLISASLSTTIAPVNGRVVVIASIPPTLELSQEQVKTLSKPAGVLFRPNKQETFLVVNRESDENMTVSFDYSFMYKRRALVLAESLLSSPYRSQLMSQTSISDDIRNTYLKDDSTLDFLDPVFQEYMRKHNLARRSDEEEIIYAHRAMHHLATSIKYHGGSKMKIGDGQGLSKVINNMTTADCGGHALLFVALLRANHIPARTIGGQFCDPHPTYPIALGLSATDLMSQIHVKAEFFLDGTGWIPVEPTSKDGKWFGADQETPFLGKNFQTDVSFDLHSLDSDQWPVNSICHFPRSIQLFHILVGNQVEGITWKISTTTPETDNEPAIPALYVQPKPSPLPPSSSSMVFPSAPSASETLVPKSRQGTAAFPSVPLNQSQAAKSAPKSNSAFPSAPREAPSVPTPSSTSGSTMPTRKSAPRAKEAPTPLVIPPLPTRADPPRAKQIAVPTPQPKNFLPSRQPPTQQASQQSSQQYQAQPQYQSPQHSQQYQQPLQQYQSYPQPQQYLQYHQPQYSQPQNIATVQQPTSYSIDVPTPNIPLTVLPSSRYARALWNFAGEQAGDLSFSAGDIIKVTTMPTTEWWSGEKFVGFSGQFPWNYVELLQGQAVACTLYDFEAKVAGDLGFQKGEYILVTSQDGSGWWRGNLRGYEGQFPANYVIIQP